MNSTALLASIAVFGANYQAPKKPLDHSVYDSWKTIRGTTISNDGKWIAYAIAPQEGDMILEIQNTKSGVKKAYPIGQSLTLPTGAPIVPRISFSKDSKFLITTILPKLDDYKKARKDKVKPDDQPKNGLLIVDLDKATDVQLPKITSWQIAREDSGFILFRPEPPKTEPAKPDAAKPEAPKPEAPKADAPKPAAKELKKKADHKAGDTYVLRNLATGAETKIDNVSSAAFNKTGETLLLTLSDKDGKGDGVSVLDVSTGKSTEVVKQLGRYPRTAISDDSKQVAFVTDKDDYVAKTPTVALYHFDLESKKLIEISKLGDKDLPKDWAPSANGALTFSESGKRLRFGIAPKPEADPEVNADEAVSVDIWHWQDPLLQSQQLMQAAAERNRTYDVLFEISTGKKLQLETPEIPNSTLSNKFDNRYALLSSNRAYQKLGSWGGNFSDFYSLDTKTGEKVQLAQKTEAGLSLSPDGAFAYGYAEDSKELVSYSMVTGKRTVLNAGLPPIWDEKNDVPGSAGLVGLGGITAENEVLVYDAFDIWLVDLKGERKPKSITGTWGRSREFRYRVINLTPEESYVDLKKPLYLSVVDTDTMSSGFATLESIGKRPTILSMEPKLFGASAGLNGVVQNFVTKAKNADTIFYTRQSFTEFPDLWLADSTTLANPRKITNANPQQADYNWGSVDTINYRSNDGSALKGLLYRPENFDPTKKYPMIVYFYERDSELLHAYRAPAPSASTINIPLFVSNGYIVLVPDIKYKVGYPGESAVGSILPATQEVLRRGYVDPKRVGIQGQSWGGYQVGYLVTETDMFAAGCAGAPVSNMISAYGGIRGESGVVREGQYEQGQSRIGGSIWEKPLQFMENSPILHADKIKTPLFIMSNDKDGAVPWQQGIEYFTALRRLEKPAWMVSYNGEAHNLVERRNRKDFSVRLSQFFDFYLKDGPLPVWMAEGVPAVKKGRTMGLEPAKKPK